MKYWQDEVAEKVGLVKNLKTQVGGGLVYTFYEYRDLNGTVWMRRLVEQKLSPRRN